PEVEVILRIECGDEPVGDGDVKQGEESRGFPGVEIVRHSQRARNATPPAVRSLVPEARNRRLFGRTQRAELFADRANLQHILRVLITRQRWRAIGPELRADAQGERYDIAPSRKQSWEQVGR